MTNMVGKVLSSNHSLTNYLMQGLEGLLICENNFPCLIIE